MNVRPSRFVVALARWALMMGVAGVLLASLALLDHWRSPGNIESRQNLLSIAAVLLALSFVFAPFVRRAFGLMIAPRAPRGRPQTLLDEMRGQPQGELRENPASNPADGRQSTQTSPLARFILLLYLVFGATLVAVLIAMQ
jgi:hypothetical protein